MATVISYVDPRIEENVQVGIMCQSCGSGTTAEKEPKPCRCNKGMMEPYTFDFSRSIPGFVVIRCDCGARLECQHFTNTCSCGRDYNFAGTQLGPREFWGEETGELPSGCV